MQNSKVIAVSAKTSFMNNQPIGVLDSGVGGLTIWKDIVKELPYESTIYLADSANCPYGEKSKKEIYSLSKRLVGFLLGKNVKLIVLACNTITVFCIDKLRREFSDIPIVGTVPAVKTVAEVSKNKKIGILSTEATANSKYQKDLIAKFAKGLEVINLGTNELVPFVERGEVRGEAVEKVLKKTLKSFTSAKVDGIALGCSHFPLLKSLIEKNMGDKVEVLDSGKAIARQVKRVLTNNNVLSLQKNPSYTFYTTGNDHEFIKVIKKLIKNQENNLIKSVKTIYL